MRRFALPLLEQTNRNMTMPRRHSKWQIGGTRGAFLLLHGLLCGSVFLAFAAPVQAQPCLYVVNQLRGAVEAFRRPELSLVASVGLTECVLPQCMPTALAVDTGRLRAYVTRQDAGSVQVIDMTGGHAPVRIAVGVSPSDLVLNSDGSRLYVANLATDTVSVIDTNLDAVIDTIPVGDGPRGLAIRPDNSRVYVANANDDTVSVIDTGTDTAIDTLTVVGGGGPAAVRLTPDATQLYVSNQKIGTVSVVELAGGPVRSVTVGRGPRAIGFASGTTAFVTNTLDGTLSPIDTATEMAGDAIAVGRGPIDVVITDDGSTGYVANLSDNTLSILDVASGDVTTLTNQGAPFDLALGSCPLLPTPTVTVTVTAAPSATPTPGGGCVGDCSGDGMVVIGELISGVNIALGNSPVSSCPAFDVNGDGMVGINELIAAVNAALNGC